MKEKAMTEPVSTAFGATLGAKAIGSTAGAVSFAAVLAVIVVMIRTIPTTVKEWTIGIISTVVFSLALGAYVTIKLDLVTPIVAATNDVALFFALVQVFGIVFVCGLPGWAIVRAVFLYIDKHRDDDVGQLFDDVKGKL